MTTVTGPSGEARPRILIENSEYWLRNNGDLAMLTITIERIRSRWPDARIGVLTDSPALLAAYFPAAEAITVTGTATWNDRGLSAMVAGRLGPRSVGPPAIARLRTSAIVPQHAHALRHKLHVLRSLASGSISPELEADEQDASSNRPAPPPVVAAVRSSSLVLALGGGYLTDADPAQTRRVLGLLECAIRHGVPTALLGQGLGPLDHPPLRARAADVLPRTGYIGLREGRRGPELAAALGVPPDRRAVTGDDAIELAYSVRAALTGRAIGVCLRDTDYFPTGDEPARIVGEVVKRTAGEHSAPLAAIPIAEYRAQDRRTTLQLIRGYSEVIAPPARFAHPRAVASRVSGCRIVVTGAYHLAVFALSQGIPAVVLTSSTYYDDKFHGLAGMFGDGVTVVPLNGDGLRTRLADAVEAAWTQAPALRAPLLAAARVQIDLSRKGFRCAAALAAGHQESGVPDGPEGATPLLASGPR
ncbi:polysaccharide pyruvyl transferase family protein [Tomitella fengzijianii]|uniref:Polysaccharide pyruvyl transferase family protein n=1 Tax=Tomitella fengzijianii TaxID=2597660 RepID=A0A516X0S2_9ACTN|nr:polysaccharide pyruvyl transferase family protein [Tomitella fengzijianii]QDQ96668.1 polysaccharide pyruvyl transferase family protein [Tomitella fengzijianii]